MSDPENKIIVSVQMEEADLRRANLWFALSRRWFPAIVFLYLLCAILCYWVDLIFLAVIFAVGMVITPLAVLLAIWFNTKRTFSDLKDFQKSLSFTFSEIGLETTGQKAVGQMNWDHILKVVESKHSINLFLQRNFFLVVPKRFIEDPIELNRIREILKNNLGDKARLQLNS